MLIILNKKVTEYKVVCRISAQLCEEKKAQKENLAIILAVVTPKGTGFFPFLLILFCMKVDYSDNREKNTYKHSLAILVQPQVHKMTESLGCPPETINITINSVNWLYSNMKYKVFLFFEKKLGILRLLLGFKSIPVFKGTRRTEV